MTQQKLPNIKGFLGKPKRTGKGNLRQGRFTCHDVQWTGGAGTDALLATFTISADELAETAASNLLWTDQDVQRGIKPGLNPQPSRELSLANGYPDPEKYIFDGDNADEIARKLLDGERLFLSPLVWNLRPEQFVAYWDAKKESLYIYDGKIYLPDSHHRQQAIIKAVQLAATAPSEYKGFSPDRQFKLELYFLSREDEGNYFFDKNQRPKPTALSKAYDLTTLDDLSLLAKKVIEKSKNLQGNVNRVTDRLAQGNPQVVTLSTLREMMKSYSPHESLEEGEVDGLADIAASFYDMLAEIRPELGPLELKKRRLVREKLLSDSAVMMHGYAALMKEFHKDLVARGTVAATELWHQKLKRLRNDTVYTFGAWSGDLFAKSNPLWKRVGVVKPSKSSDKLTTINTGGARGECGRVLLQLLSVPREVTALEFLVTRR
jgi:hypothetical protein